MSHQHRRSDRHRRFDINPKLQAAKLLEPLDVATDFTMVVSQALFFHFFETRSGGAAARCNFLSRIASQLYAIATDTSLR